MATAAAPDVTRPDLEVEISRLTRARRRDRMALEGLVRVLRVLREGVRALEAENRQLRAQLYESRD
jgi:hypothetical protein